MTSHDDVPFDHDLASRWLNRQLLIETAQVVATHEALSPRDLNRRRWRAYAEGLLRGWNLHARAHGRRGWLTLERVARLSRRRSVRQIGSNPTLPVRAIDAQRDDQAGGS